MNAVERTILALVNVVQVVAFATLVAALILIIARWHDARSLRRATAWSQAKQRHPARYVADNVADRDAFEMQVDALLIEIDAYRRRAS